MMNINNLKLKAYRNVQDILSICIKHNQIDKKALVVYDENSELAKILLEAYSKALPNANFINFDKSNKDEILNEFNKMQEHDLVIMIQSTNFLLNEFRIRLHLFNNKLKVIEHMHLARNTEEMWDTYIDSLAYDIDWYPMIAPIIKNKLDTCDKISISYGATTLTTYGGLEPAMLNIGDYTGMKNVGGTFPIGEVFTESKVLNNLNGEIFIYAFADRDFNVQMYEPFLIRIERGEIIWYADNAPSLFIEILNLVKSYERPIIREIGFGLNRSISKENYLRDITAYERVYGMHLSLGEKHSVYKKSGMTTNKTKFHIDIFPLVDKVELDDSIIIYQNGKYV